MSVIAKLKLVASKRERFLSPTVARRQKLADKLEQLIVPAVKSPLTSRATILLHHIPEIDYWTC